MTATATTTPVAAVVSIPDLLDSVAPRIVRMPHRSYSGLHRVCRSVAAGRLGLDLDTDQGHQASVRLADWMLWHVAEHLIDQGQHPQPDVRRTLADWLLSTPLTGVVAEFGAAARWWRCLQAQGRSL